MFSQQDYTNTMQQYITYDPTCPVVITLDQLIAMNSIIQNLISREEILCQQI